MLNVLTFAVAALGGISLLVGAVGMVTLMHISVAERVLNQVAQRPGATRGRIRMLFLMESTVLSTLGGLAGRVGTALASLLGLLINDLPVSIPWNFVLAALGASMVIGLAAGSCPQATANPVEALRTE